MCSQHPALHYIESLRDSEVVVIDDPHALADYPMPKVLVADAITADHVSSLVDRGIFGFVAPNAGTGELAAAVLCARVEMVALPHDYAMTAFDALSGADSRPAETGEMLTRRERDVLRLLGRGISNKAIGTALQISNTRRSFT